MNRRQIMPYVGGQKWTQNTGSEEQMSRLAYNRQELYNALSFHRERRMKDLCRIVFDPFTRSLVLSKYAGKHWQFMGQKSSHGLRVLYPEEALYLVDMAAAEVYCNDVALSLEQVFQLAMQQGMTWEHYAVYSHLCRAGYIVIRHRCSGRPAVPSFESTTSEMTARPPGYPATAASCNKPLAPAVESVESYTVSKNEAGSSADPGSPSSETDAPEAITKSEKGAEPTHPPSDNEWPSAATATMHSSKPAGYCSWDFTKIQFPDNHGHPLLWTKPVDSRFLPFPLTYKPQMLAYDSRNAEGNDWRCRKALRKNEFYRPSDLFLPRPGKNVRNWGEYKKATEAARAFLDGRTCSFGYPPGFMPKSTSDDSLHSKEMRPCSEILYDVHLANSGFSFSCAGRPHHRLIVSKASSPFLAPDQLVLTRCSSYPDVPTYFAIADGEKVLFFDFQSIHVPFVNNAL